MPTAELPSSSIGAGSARRPAATRTRSNAGWCLLALLLGSGCTVGYLADENGTPINVGEASLIAFLPVDSAGNLIPEGGGTSKHYFAFDGTYAGATSFSFDPLVPTSSNVNGTGVPNLKQILPEGDYIIVVMSDKDIPGTPRAEYVSPIFTHSYYHVCGDFFTKDSVPCALYELRLYSSNYPSNPKGLLVQGVVHSIPMKKVPDNAAAVPPGRITSFTAP
jgi:hypothetical protein